MNIQGITKACYSTVVLIRVSETVLSVKGMAVGVICNTG